MTNPIILGEQCPVCHDTGLVETKECQCQAGRRLKITRIYPWMDESQIEMRLVMLKADQQMREAIASEPMADRGNRGLEPESDQ